jgi:hypothetical protein
MDLMGLSMSGPLLSSISKGTPMAGSGVRMSEKRMTPSGRNERKGWGRGQGQG